MFSKKLLCSFNAPQSLLQQIAKLKNHVGHAEKSPCEIEGRHESTIDPNDIYERHITGVIKKDYLISDKYNYIPQYKAFRETLNTIKQK